MTDIYEPTVGVLVEADPDLGFTAKDVFEEAEKQQPLIAALVRWSNELQQRPINTREGGLFERDRFIAPRNIYDQMRLAYDAAERDDVVAGVLESTEALAFSKVGFYAEDPDDEDIYNQIAADIDLDARLREMWREMFTVSQFVAAVWWHTKTFKVRGTTDKGTKRRKEYRVTCPKAITILDPLKIVPVGSFLFNKEQLAYHATRTEDEAFEKGTDEIAQRLITGRYVPTEDDAWLVDMKIDKEKLWLLNPETVFRHTATRPQYQPFASVRMRSVFELLDLKQQLKQMDRAHLIGGTNFILVIKKGTDQLPAKPQEIAHLQGQARMVARLPVLIGDHRLSVDIVTPKLDQTLKAERYNSIDSRITARLYQTFVSGAYQTGTTGDDSIKLVKVIARGMESRRHMLLRTLERNVLQPMFDKNKDLETSPKLRFNPKNIALDFDQAMATFMLDLRANSELSRETILSQFDIDQADEARLLEREREVYDDIFKTAIPFDSPQNNQQRTPAQPVVDPAAKPKSPADDSGAKTPEQQRRAGRRQGGTKSGGGAAPGTGQGQPAKNPRRTSK